jgi:hypothetical protein
MRWQPSIAVWLLVGVGIAGLVLLVWEYRTRKTEAWRRSALLAYAVSFQDHARGATTQPGSVPQAFLDSLPPSLSSRLFLAEDNQQLDRLHSILYINEGDSKDHPGWFLILTTSEPGRCHLVIDGKRSWISRESAQDMIAGSQNVETYIFRGR